MFGLTIEERDLLEGLHYNVKLRVQASRWDGLFTDLTDRFVRGTMSAHIDDAARRATFFFSRGLGTTSLSPFIAASTLNTPPVGGFADTALLYPGGEFSLEAQVVAPGAAADPLAWRMVWWGRIDEVNPEAAPGLVSVTGRDIGTAKALDLMIEVPTIYGTPEGQDIEEVLVQIMADWGVGQTLYLPTGSPGWAIKEYPQQEASVMEAMRQLALQIGWDLRHLPSIGLALYDPGRTRSIANATIAPNQYLQVREFKVSDTDVRNVVEVFYDVSGTRQRVQVIDNTSRERFGRRFMRLVEDKSTNIDTQAEALTFATFALADCRDPFASHGIELPFWPFVELNDLHNYPANGVHYDNDLQLAVVAYEHSLDKDGKGRTTINARGKPIAAYRRYRGGMLRMWTVSLGAPPEDTIAPEGHVWWPVDSVA